MGAIIGMRYILRGGEKVLQKLEGNIYPNDENDGYDIGVSTSSGWEDVETEGEK